VDDIRKRHAQKKNGNGNGNGNGRPHS
jgi:hypothetical protein